MEQSSGANRRKYFRVECATPICSEVTVVRINNQPVNTGTTKVCVEDIGPGGLKFISKLDLPANPNFIVKFYIVIIDKPLLIEGFIVRKSEFENGIFRYGVQFVVDDSKVNNITELLSKLNYLVGKGIKDTGSSYCIKNKMECFRISKVESEKRAYLRFQCPSPLCAKLVLKKINNKAVNADGDTVCIEDIGQGGLRFLSHIDYPVIRDMLFEFQMIVLDHWLFLNGYIVRKHQIEKGIYEYGVKFDILKEQKQEIGEAIEAMKRNLSRKLWFKKSSFCIKDKLDCLRSRSLEVSL
jgi:hypothetical protein